MVSWMSKRNPLAERVYVLDTVAECFQSPADDLVGRRSVTSLADVARALAVKLDFVLPQADHRPGRQWRPGFISPQPLDLIVRHGARRARHRKKQFRTGRPLQYLGLAQIGIDDL